MATLEICLFWKLLEIETSSVRSNFWSGWVKVMKSRQLSFQMLVHSNVTNTEKNSFSTFCFYSTAFIFFKNIFFWILWQQRHSKTEVTCIVKTDFRFASFWLRTFQHTETYACFKVSYSTEYKLYLKNIFLV